MSQASTSVVSSSTQAFTQPAPSTLPAGYVEANPSECGKAKVAHLLGIFGIVGTGIHYVLKCKESGEFVRDQMKEAFNFHLLVFAMALALSIAGTITVSLLGRVALLFSLASLALFIGAIALSIVNAMKAGKGQVARYPARLAVLK
jgi:uncharacterized Tic20 family protein